MQTTHTNLAKWLLARLVAAAVFLSAPVALCEVANSTEGATNGDTMTDGNTYVVQDSVSFSHGPAWGRGMNVAEDATVVLYVPARVRNQREAETSHPVFFSH